MDSWGGVSAASSPLNANWENHLSGQLPSTGWWKDIQNPFAYNQGWSNAPSIDYDPGSMGQGYSPTSSLTMSMITGDIDAFLMREHPELFDFTAGWQQGGVAGAGKVAQDPTFGQFHKTPEVYAEIQAAADKYGVPANFLQAIIAKESSGNWAGNSQPVNVSSRGGARIHGYIGVFENAATAWGFDFNRGIGNRAYQIEMLAGGLRRMYDQIHAKNPQYGWLNVAAMHYSGDPTGASTPGDSWQHGSTQHYMSEVEQWWKRLDGVAGNTWSNYTSTGQGTGVGSPNNAQWAPVNQWDRVVAGASQKYGVPANLIKAVMRFESNGNVNAVSPQGATGLMQVMPFHVGGDQAALFNPETNIDVGTRILMDNYRRYGSWEMAAKAYLGLGGADAHGTTSSTYWQRVNAYWQELNAGASGLYGAPGVPTTTTQMEAIWGGAPTNGITQEMGPTSWSQGAGAWMYDYGADLGVIGHPGLDIGMQPGTLLYSPGAGYVERISNEYYQDFSGSGPNRGELRIRLDNGHILILGHIQSASVKVGDRVTAGLLVGRSGKYKTDRIGHLHLEYRIPAPGETRAGWKAVDPRQYLGGTFSGTHQGAKTGLGYTQPLTFQNLMRAGASGQEIPDGPVYSMGGGRSSWSSWLRNAMQGNVPSRTNPGNYTYTYSAGSNMPDSY